MKPFFPLAVLLTFSAVAVHAHYSSSSFCVVNLDDTSALFAVDADGVYRDVKVLAPGESLCTPEFAVPVDGFVSVFVDENAIEGCSRLAPAGSVQVLLKYQDFDNCAWQINP